jgi:hypothetical protein
MMWKNVKEIFLMMMLTSYWKSASIFSLYQDVPHVKILTHFETRCLAGLLHNAPNDHHDHLNGREAPVRALMTCSCSHDLCVLS